MAKKLKLAEGISKPLVINSDYKYKTDVTLTKDGTTDGKQLFFGIKKNNSIDNELDDTYNKYIQSDPYIKDCVVHLYNSPYSNGKSIVYNLSENTTGSTRLITFKYNGTILFQINQAANITDDNIYVYFRKWKVIFLDHKYVVCTRNDINSLTDYNFTTINLIKNTCINTNTSTDVVLYHVTNNKDISNIFLNKTIKTLISNNTLTYVSGKKFSNDESELIKAPTKMIKNVQLQLEDVTDNSKMYVYSGSEDATKGGQIDFTFLTDELYNIIDWSNIVGSSGDITAVGKYLYNQNGTTVTPTIKSEDIYIVGFSITGSHSLYLFDSTCTSNFTDSSFVYSVEMSVHQPIVGDTTTNFKYIYYWSNNNIPGLAGTKVSDCLDNLNKLEGTGNLSIYNDVSFTHFSGKVNQKGTSQRKTVLLNDNINVFTHENGEYKHKCTINFGNMSNMYNLGKWRYTYTV